MLMLDNSCIRNFTLCVIDNSISLIVLTIKNFCLKSDRTILQCSQLISKIFIDAVLGFFSYQAQMRWVFRQREPVEIEPQREAKLP